MKPKNKKIAVTGGVGSGKSLFCRYLREEGFPVFSCDEINAKLWEDGEYLALLKKTFPSCVVDGKMDKKTLSKHVFQDDSALQTLNGLAHGRIMQLLFAKMEGYPLAFAEVPLLFETGTEGQFDGVIAVVRDREKRIEGVIARDCITRGEIEARMNRQFDPKRLKEKRCVIVENNGTSDDLHRQVREIIGKIDALFAN